MNHTTKRHPRTLNEAFGPYTSHDFEHDRTYDWQDVLVMAACTIISLGFLIYAVLA